MSKKRARILIAVAAFVVLAGVLSAPRIFGRLGFFEWEAPPVGAVLAERWSPDGDLVATLTAGDSAGRYIFTLRRNADVVARREVSATVGYHPQIVRVEWAPDGSRAIATIDHDFGENNVQVALERPRSRKRS